VGWRVQELHFAQAAAVDLHHGKTLAVTEVGA